MYGWSHASQRDGQVVLLVAPDPQQVVVVA